MQIVVKANAEQKRAFLAKGVAEDVLIHWCEHEKELPQVDAYFDLDYEEEGPAFLGITDKPVFINSVIETSERLTGNFIRLNAWNGFLERDSIEIVVADLSAGRQGSQIIVDHILKNLGWKYQTVPDLPGMIAARVIAMIINEAYFGLGDEISTKADIDTAMKLGTNYPLGPFEWSEKIGLHKIYSLLKKLSEQDSRYTVAPALEKELTTQ
jgi:3-hydroxybutyryl-CoA dehydrogenase